VLVGACGASVMDTHEENHTYAMRGPRDELSLRPVQGLSMSCREEVQQRLSVVTEEWCQFVIDGVRARKRTALNLWAQAMRVIGSEQVINVNLATMTAWGMPADEVTSIIEASKSNAMGLDEAQVAGVDLLKWCVAQDPERRAAILSALGGSDGREIGNGTTNGTPLHG
jgi:hypothetical protein